MLSGHISTGRIVHYLDSCWFGLVYGIRRVMNLRDASCPPFRAPQLLFGTVVELQVWGATWNGPNWPIPQPMWMVCPRQNRTVGGVISGGNPLIFWWLEAKKGMSVKPLL